MQLRDHEGCARRHSCTIDMGVLIACSVACNLSVGAWVVGWPDVAIPMACQAFVILNSLNTTLIISSLWFALAMYQLCVSEVFTIVVKLGYCVRECLLCMCVCIVSMTTVSWSS